MNWSISQTIDAVMPAAVATGLFSVTATFQAPDGSTDPSGAPSGTYVNVSGLVGLVGMAAPPGMSTIQATEVKSPQDILAMELLHLLLTTFYEPLDNGWRNGWRCQMTFQSGDVVAYDVLGVESDSQEQMTRVRLRLTSI